MTNIFLELQIFLEAYERGWIAPLLILNLLGIFYAASFHFRLSKAKALLYQSKKEMEGIAKLAMTNPHPLIQINIKGNIRFINPAALELFPGILKNGLKHPAFEDLDLQNLPLNGLERDLVINKRIYHQSVFPAGKDPEHLAIFHCVDITSLKQAEKELQISLQQAEQSRRTAEQAKEARGDFLANMSHELRTPMNGIIGLAGLLMEGERDKHKKKLAEGVYHSATNLLGLLNDILDFSKIEAGELRLEMAAFSPTQILNDLITLYSNIALEKGIKFEVRAQDNIPAACNGDALRLRQILNNLVSNAIKFTAHGYVRISVCAQHKSNETYTLTFQIEDTGIGIAEDKQALVFEKFRQADTSTARQYGGTGLGLSITKRLSDLMGGTLSLNSVLNEGTIITFSLDLESATENDLPAIDVDTTTLLNPETKILIADDHPVNLLFLRNVLQKAGLKNIEEAINGHEALEAYKNSPHDIILMDCQMPEMDGFTSAALIRQYAKTINHTPFILAVTADAMKAAVDKASQSGMDDYISKPIDKRLLLDILSQNCGINPVVKNAGNQDISLQPLSLEQDMTILDLPILNPAVLNDYSDGDSEMERNMGKIFINNLYLDFAALEKALGEENYRAWNESAHKLYGACANFGAERLAAICDTAQEIPIDETDEISKIHQDISKHYKDLINILKNQHALYAA
jgi:signal transduction histidine kinase/CheY-like chemotaxis protein